MHEKDQLIELYEASGSTYILDTLINRFGYKVLLELENEQMAMKIFVSSVILSGDYNTLFHLNVNELRKVYNYIINNFSTQDNEYKDKIMIFLEKYNFEFTHVTVYKNSRVFVDKKIFEENVRFLYELYLSEKIYFRNDNSNNYEKMSYADDILEAISDNINISLETIIQIAHNVNDLYIKIIQKLNLRIANASTTTAIIYALNLIRDAVIYDFNDLSKNSDNPEQIIIDGLDLFMDGRFFIDNIFDIFLSIQYTPVHYVSIYKDLYKLFYERFTLNFMDEEVPKEIIELEYEINGTFPVTYISNKIINREVDGLLFLLYYFEDLKSYEIFSYMSSVNKYFDEVEYAFTYMVQQNLVPENWLANTNAYKELIKTNFKINTNNLNTDIDIDALLEDINI